jgi:two-component system response regulator GlrR
MVVDDEKSVRRVTEFLLTKLGHRITLAENGHEAIKILQDAQAKGENQPFDLVMLDMVMEEEFDGLTTFEELARLCPKINVIVASGYAPTERAKTILSKGAGWLAKPYGMQDLAAAIQKKLIPTAQ